MNRSKIIFVVILLLALSITVTAADWPAFRGADHAGKSEETGLLKNWGPTMLWSVEGVGEGFSSLTIADGMVYISGMIGDDKMGYIQAFDLKGNQKWKTAYGPEWSKSYPGARSAPSVSHGKVYIMSGNGLAACFDAKNGKKIWSVDTVEKFGARNIKWGISESVLVYKGMAICTPGGEGATIVALDANTGEFIWKTEELNEKSAYCTAILAEHNGRTLLITNIEKSIAVVDPDTGELVCHIPHEKRHSLAAVSPVYYNGTIYVTSGYTRDDMPDRGACYELSADAKASHKNGPRENWNVTMAGVVLLDGCVHGSSAAIYPPASKENPKGNWYCLDLNTGQVKYEAKMVGKGCVIYADGMLYCYGENGQLALVKPGEKEYQMISSFTIEKGTSEHWAHPAISDGVMYLRHGDALMAFDINAK